MDNGIPNPPQSLGNCRFFKLRSGSMEICLHRKNEDFNVSFLLVATVNYDADRVFEIVSDGKETEYVIAIPKNLGTDMIRSLDYTTFFPEHDEKIKSHEPNNVEFREIPWHNACSHLKKRAKEILEENMTLKTNEYEIENENH